MKRLMIVILLAVFLVVMAAPQPAEAVFLADDVVIGAGLVAILAVTLVVGGIAYFVKAIAGEAPAEQAGQQEAEPPPGPSEREDSAAASYTSPGDQRCNVLPYTANCR